MSQMEYGLRMDLSQKLVMTPQLRQAIAILQLPALELASMIEQELLENPVLEQEEEREEFSPDNLVKLAEYLQSGERNTGEAGTRGEREDEGNPLERCLSQETTLHQHLEMQLSLLSLPRKENAIGEYLIGCIDDNGYLCGSVAEAAHALEISEVEVERVLFILQSFEPCGVAARDLRECLLLQLQQQECSDELLLELVENHLDEVGMGHYRALALKLKCAPQQVQEAVDLIKRLDPKPGLAFGGSTANYILPDLTVEKVDGQYVVLVNDTVVPRLTINSAYRRMVQNGDDDLKKFVSGRLQAAVGLIRSIEQRRRTLYRVMETIIELQHDFLEYGPAHLQPLTLRQVAEIIEMHESTVSRAIAGKYAATPRGLLSLRSFFPTPVHTNSGADMAAANVKQNLRELIAKEDTSRPFSDQDLAEILAEKGIKLSRRTVAKYREELNIPTSNRRRRY